MSVADNEKRIARLELESQRKDVCDPIRRRLEGRMADVERKVSMIDLRLWALLVIALTTLLTVAFT